MENLSEQTLHVIESFQAPSVSPQAARFARAATAASAPENPNRAKAFLFAASRLGAFAEAVGLELSFDVLFRPSVIERACDPRSAVMSDATRRTLRTNLRALMRRVNPQGPASPPLPRERAKAPYAKAQIARYLALADAQSTEARRRHAGALICLGAGAGIVGADLKAVRGTDVHVRSGGVVVDVHAPKRARSVPVLARYHERLVGAAAFADEDLIIGGTPTRRNVTTPLTAMLSEGGDLPRLDIARLRSTWLVEVAGVIGLGTFMDAAGITCSQRLGDLVADLDTLEEARAVTLLGGSTP